MSSTVNYLSIRRRPTPTIAPPAPPNLPESTFFNSSNLPHFPKDEETPLFVPSPPWPDSAPLRTLPPDQASYSLNHTNLVASRYEGATNASHSVNHHNHIPPVYEGAKNASHSAESEIPDQSAEETASFLSAPQPFVSLAKAEVSHDLATFLAPIWTSNPAPIVNSNTAPRMATIPALKNFSSAPPRPRLRFSDATPEDGSDRAPIGVAFSQDGADLSHDGVAFSQDIPAFSQESAAISQDGADSFTAPFDLPSIKYAGSFSDDYDDSEDDVNDDNDDSDDNDAEQSGAEKALRPSEWTTLSSTPLLDSAASLKLGSQDYRVGQVARNEKAQRENDGVNAGKDRHDTGKDQHGAGNDQHGAGKDQHGAGKNRTPVFLRNDAGKRRGSLMRLSNGNETMSTTQLNNSSETTTTTMATTTTAATTMAMGATTRTLVRGETTPSTRAGVQYFST